MSAVINKAEMPDTRPTRPEPSWPLMEEKHNCALFIRKDNVWKWKQGGTIQRYPKVGEMVIVAYDKSRFSYTDEVVSVISIDETEPNATEIVFQDKDRIWKLILPTHSNDIATIKAELEIT